MKTITVYEYDEKNEQGKVIRHLVSLAKHDCCKVFKVFEIPEGFTTEVNSNGETVKIMHGNVEYHFSTYENGYIIFGQEDSEDICKSVVLHEVHPDNNKKKITMEELKANKNWNEAVIVFTADSFKTSFTEYQRSYKVQHDAKYFDPTKIGNSLFGNCLDETDMCVRLDDYIHADNPADRWKIDYCYILN